MNKSRNERGITLIVLVIMLVILLVLVGVPIKVMVDKGVFNHARKANNKTEEYLTERDDIHHDIRDLYR